MIIFYGVFFNCKSIHAITYFNKYGKKKIHKYSCFCLYIGYIVVVYITFLSVLYSKHMKTLSLKVLMISALALFWFGLVSVAPVSAQDFTTQQGYLWGINVAGQEGLQQDSLIGSIQTFVNRVLGILGLIALIVLLYGWFQMVTAAGDEEKYKTWFTILKQAGIGLAFIGLAWFVVSIIFFLLNLVTT